MRKKHTDLDQDLDRYHRRSRRRARPGRAGLLAYSAAATGVALIAPEAVLGGIVHKTTQQTFAVTNSNRPGTNPFTIDIDGAGGADWSFRMSGTSNFAGFGPAAYIVGIGTASEVATSGRQYDALPLNPSFNVSARADFNTNATDNGAQVFGSGNAIGTGGLPAGATNYMGLRFQGDTGVGGAQYAWLKVRPDFNSTTGKATFTIFEWAFDDSGAAIHVADTGPSGVPTPDTAWLALLGIGAVGVQAFRRRRAQHLEQIASNQDTTA